MPDKSRMMPDDRDLAIRTIIGEASDQPEEGQAAVAHVIMNRLRSGRYGSSPSDVVLSRGQFEPWQTRARELMSISPKSRQYQRIGDLFDRVVGGDYADPTNGATHFLEENIVRRRTGGRLPSWASGNGQRIGDHTFYAPEGRVGALPYADATSGAGAPGERTDARAPGGAVRTAQAGGVSPDDIAETLRQLGLSTASTASEGHPNIPSNSDVEETLRQAGVTMGRAAQPMPKPPTLPEPAEGRLGPAAQAEAERTSQRLNPITALATETPIIGPGVTAASALIRARPGREPPVPGENYEQRAVQSRMVLDEAQRLYRERNPGTALGAGLIGSTALTGAGMLSYPGRLMMGAEGIWGPSLASKIYSGTIGGAGTNALDAALRGENVPNAAMIGAGGGMLGPLVGAGIQGAGQGIARNLPVYSGPLADTNAITRGRLSDIIGEGGVAEGRTRMGPAGFLGDVNQAATDIAGGVADTPGMGKALVRAAYRARDAAARNRIDDAVTRTVGPHVDIEGFKRFTTEARKAAADPLYEQWRSMQVKPTDKLKELIPRLEDAGAFKMAEELSGISGRKINKAFFTGGPVKEFPTTESWDYVKRGLDRRIDQAYTAGDKTLARELVNLKHELIDEIGKTPAGKVWKQARQEFASRSAILDQVEAGRDTFLGGRSGLSVDELKHELRGLQGPELAARVQGLRAAVDQVMGDTLTGDTSLRNKILADNNQQKMRLLLGRDRADELIRTMKQEKFLKDQSQDIVGGTQTTPKKERVDALKPSQNTKNPVPSFNVLAPASYFNLVPGSSPWAMNDARNAMRYGDSLNQLGQLMLTPNDARLDRLLEAMSREGRRRSRIENASGTVGNLLSALTAGPGTSTARRNIFPTQ